MCIESCRPPLERFFLLFPHSKTASALFSSRYFEDDEEESSSNVDLPYIPAENSPTRQQMKAGGGSDSDDDPLDAFMAEVEVGKERANTVIPL